MVCSTADHLSWQPSRLSWNGKCAVLQRLKAPRVYLKDDCPLYLSPSFSGRSGDREGNVEWVSGEGNRGEQGKSILQLRCSSGGALVFKEQKPLVFRPLENKEKGNWFLPLWSPWEQGLHLHSFQNVKQRWTNQIQVLSSLGEESSNLEL